MIAILLLLFTSGSWAGDAMGFECRLLYPAQEQGQERFVRLKFPSSGEPELKIADLTSPYLSVGELVRFQRGHYTHQDSSAYAAWAGADGVTAVEIALGYFGSWWGAVLTFHRDLNSPSISFKAGESVDLRCEERPE